MQPMAKSYDPKEVEERLSEQWEKEGIYRFDPKSEAKIYAIDTPPPTISGKMHLGHAFSYTQMDFIARYQRQRGKNMFYPFGTDDNGIATEIYVEKMNKVKASKMDRREFNDLCLKTLENIRPEMVRDWKDIGLSCDFSLFYSTRSDHCQRISQRSFIDLYNKGREYRKEAPVLWCPTCQTAISQVECDDMDKPSYFNDITFMAGDEELTIGTTRPEFLPACVAVFHHPDDARYQHLTGKTAKVPISGQEVPIIADSRADPEKGTGLVMCCTFGDQTDIEWYFAYDLPLRPLLQKDGRLSDIAGEYAGMAVEEARLAIIRELERQGLLQRQKEITHTVNIHERCDKEIEIIHSKQWFIKYLDLKDRMLEWGSALNWYPQHMKVRYDNWVKGLQWDWLISRQRYSGIPIPAWYCGKCEQIVIAREEDLPVDPLQDEPPVSQCPACGHEHFVPESDVLDTWATSSLTPQLAIELVKDEKVREKLYPMSLRAQAHDIITFWLFNTVVKSQLHNHVNPWKDVVISGHAQDPHGRKMSKSKGNVISPQEMMERYSADALRYWAAGSKLGDDLPFQEKDLVTGKKTTTKLWNASKFCFMHLEDYEEAPVSEIMDKWLISRLHRTIRYCTESFEAYEYSKAKSAIDQFFWHDFCDNYLEICKDRLYNPEGRGEEARKSAQRTLYEGLSAILKLFAPIMPFVTDEVYRHYFAEREGATSVHVGGWPDFDETLLDENAEKVGAFLLQVIEDVRRAKSERNVSLKTPVKDLKVQAKITQLDFDAVEEELKSVTKAAQVSFTPIPDESEEDFACSIELEE